MNTTQDIQLTQYLNEQRDWITAYLEHGLSESLALKANELKQSYICKANELTDLYQQIICHFASLDYNLSLPSANELGFVDLFNREYFLWSPLPYPRYIAEYGALLFLSAFLKDDLETLQLAEKIANWQIKTLDHQFLPIRSLWSQEKASYSQIHIANYFLFKLAALYAKSSVLKEISSIIASKLDQTKIDLGDEGFSFNKLVDSFKTVSGNQTQSDFILDCLVKEQKYSYFLNRESDHTFYCTGNGCKSGYGAFYSNQVGLVNFGPQFLPLGDCQSFGILNELESKVEEDNYYFCSSMALKNVRETSFEDLQDASFSGLWQKIFLRKRQKKIYIKTQTENGDVSEIAFVFFVKGEECLVAGNQKLRPKSLDRYKGPSYSIAIKSNQEQMTISTIKPVQMEIIPLAGEKSFWGADFLIAYFPKNYQMEWELEL